MFKVIKKDTIVKSINDINCVSKSVDVILVSVFVNFGYISHRFHTIIFTVNFELVNTDWE